MATTAAVLTVIWFTFLQARSTPGGLREIVRQRLRSHLAACTKVLSRSFFAAGVVALAGYLVLAPLVGERVEMDYQIKQAAIQPVGE